MSDIPFPFPWYWWPFVIVIGGYYGYLFGEMMCDTPENRKYQRKKRLEKQEEEKG